MLLKLVLASIIIALMAVWLDPPKGLTTMVSYFAAERAAGVSALPWLNR